MADIWEAAEAGDVGEVERLVGQDLGLLDATNGNGSTPLLLAAAEGHVGVVRWLLDRGAAIDQRDAYGHTALCAASFYGPPPVVRLLVERGADPTIPTQRGWTPLIMASKFGRLEIAPLLLAHPSAGATINRRNDNGVTALLVGLLHGPWGDREGAAGERARPHHR
jgi:uncharacterized protein